MYLIAFGVFAFCLASSFGYLLNDWRDRELDRSHPIKRLRPFASETLKRNDFLILISLCLILIIFLLPFLPSAFSLCLIFYAAISISYSIFFKNIPVVEIIWLSSGFLIRALAGSTLVGEPPTGWFVISIFFGSIFIVSNKRLAEKSAEHKFVTRSVLKSYSINFLRTILSSSMSVTMVTYSLWVYQIHSDSSIAQISIIPFCMMLFTYSHLAEKSQGESPEDLFLSNPIIVFSSLLAVLSLVWVIYF